MKTKLIFLSAALFLIIAAFLYGERTGKAKTLAKWQANQVEIARAFEREKLKAANEAQRIRDQLFEVESAWLDESRRARVEYRDRVQEVVKYVEKNPDYDVCRLNGQRLQYVKSAIMFANDYRTGKSKD